MREQTIAGVDPAEISRTLTTRAGGLATALADVVERHGSSDPTTARTVDFLREWAGDGRSDPVIGRRLPRQPLDRVIDYCGLDAREHDLLLLAGLPEEHEGLASTFRALNPLGEPLLSVGLAAVVLAEAGVDRPAVRRMLTTGRAVRDGLLQVTGRGGLFERSVQVADRLWEALHGIDALPSSLQRLPVEPVPGLDHWLADPAARRAALLLRDGYPVSLLLRDADEVTALGRCGALAESVGLGLLAARLPADDPDRIKLLAVHAVARGAVPVVVVTDPSDGGRPAPLALADLPGPVIVVARTGAVDLEARRAVLVLPVTTAPVADRRAAWRVALPGIDDADAAELAARHPLDPARIVQIGGDARVSGQPTDPAGVAGLIRRRCAMALPDGVALTTPVVPWRRLVLPGASALQLRDAVSRLQHQTAVLDDWGMREVANATRGARLLLTGPPGTGKSLAAAAVATAAATDLLRVDVSQLVSKWIGETEKNLARAFDVAERTQAVLLLDEADALFGTRTQISDAHDRYANQETAYLLQRLESFEGIVVLTTNLRHNIDPAFLRRLDFVVDFPLPDMGARRELWALHLPPEHTASDVDIEVLARLYPIPGGWIRNAAIAAAFVAAATGERIRQAHLVASVRREYEKAPLPFPGEPARRRDDT